MLIAVLVGVFVFVSIFFLFTLREQKKQRLNIRLELLKSQKSHKPSWLYAIGLGKTRDFLKTRLDMCGLRHDPDDVFLMYILLNTVIVSVLLVARYTLLAVLMPVAVHFTAFHILDSLASKRIRKIEGQFRDFLISLALHLRVTPSFQSALSMTAATVEKPLDSYIKRVVAGVQGGESIESAISSLKTIPNVHVHTWTDSVIFAVRIKADLSKLCSRSAERLGMKIRLAGKIYAQTVQAKALMISLGGMMLFMMITTMSASPEFIQFYSSPFGRTVAGGAFLIFIFATLYVLKRIDKEMSN